LALVFVDELQERRTNPADAMVPALSALSHALTNRFRHDLPNGLVDDGSRDSRPCAVGALPANACRKPSFQRLLRHLVKDHSTLGEAVHWTMMPQLLDHMPSDRVPLSVVVGGNDQLVHIGE